MSESNSTVSWIQKGVAVKVINSGSLEYGVIGVAKDAPGDDDAFYATFNGKLHLLHINEVIPL